MRKQCKQQIATG